MKKRTLLIVTALLTMIASLFVAVGCSFESDSLKVSILNKDELTAEWVEGSSTRELDVAFLLGETAVEGRTYLVESSDSGVVSVGDDNKTLTAEGEGTATITIRVALDDGTELTDSITISVIPYLRGVEISNKAALQEIWQLNEATRTISLDFKPEYYNENNPEYTVTTSDASVVEVGADKLTLTAKKVGTATITVSAGKFSDTVELSVRPVLESMTIANKEDLAETWNDWTVERTIELAMAPAEYYTAENCNAKITCSPEGLIAVDGLTLTAKKVGTATVTVKVADKTDTFTVTIERTAPIITFTELMGLEITENGAKMGAMDNEDTVLPLVTARTCDGYDVTQEIEITLVQETATLEDGVFNGPKGTYQIEYKVKDIANENLVTTKTLEITCYRNLIKWHDSTWDYGTKYAEDANQSVKTSVAGFQLMAFNMPASEYYYAEVEYIGGGVIGMAQFAEDAEGELINNRALLSTVNNWDRYDFKFIDFDTSLFTKYNGGSWTLQEGENWLDIIYSYHLSTDRGLKVNAQGNNVHKLAVARIGEYFLTFWNDQYVAMGTKEFYGSQKTLAGLFSMGNNTFSATKISYFTGKDETNAKVKALTNNGKDVNAVYAPDEWAQDSLNTDNRNYTSYGVTEERGLSYDFTNSNTHFNGGMVSNYVWFDGDFTYTWEYKATAGNYRSIVEVRDRWYNQGSNGGIQFGAEWSGENASFSRFMLNACNLEDDYKWNEPGAGTDASQGIRFTLVRILHDNYAEYIMVGQSIAKPEQVYKRTITIGPDAANNTDGITNDERKAHWNSPVLVQWHNINLAGQYSNISWKNYAQLDHEEHSYDYSYEWSDDYATCTATRTCAFYGCDAHDTETATAVKVENAATCTTGSKTTYTATFENKAFAVQTKTVELDDALGHHMVDVPQQDSTEVSVGWNDHKACDREGCNYKEGYVEVPMIGAAPSLAFTAMEGLTIDENGDATLVAIENNGVKLPAATALTWKNEDVSASITVTVIQEGTDAKLVDGVLTAPKGTYVVEYRIVDPVNAERVTIKEVTVTFYRNLILSQDTSWQFVKQYVEDAEQTLTISTYGFQSLRFNLEPSKYYYAEAEYELEGGVPGLAHYDPTDYSGWLTSNVSNWGGYDYKFIDFKTAGEGSWNMQEGMDSLNVIYTYQLKGYLNLQANKNEKVHKIAIVRMGDYYINFWNDQYVMMSSSQKYNDKNTVPGLFVNAYGATDLKVSKINYFSGKEAVAQKVNELTHNGKDVVVNYVPFTDWGGADSQNTDNRNFTSLGVTEENGLSFNFTKSNGGFNGTMVSNYVWFDGDFTYQWDYKATAGNYRSILEIRDRWYDTKSNGGIQFGSEWSGEGAAFNRFMLNGAELKDGYQWNEPGAGTDASQGIRFTLTRKLYADYAEYTMTAQSIAKPEQVYTRTITIGASADKCTDETTTNAHWNSPVTVQWHNENLAGEYSNISWKNYVEAPTATPAE